ncbi:MAG: hypothetical protein WBO10_02900 [Pyrinomonadaceae bacterium]
MPAVHSQTPPTPTNSATNASKSDAFTRYPDAALTQAEITRKRATLTAACAAAVDELKASRTLITALDAENASLRSRLDTERELNSILTELNVTRKSESEALRKTVEAKNETIAAKDAVIASQDKLVEALKTKKPSPWRRLGDILIGAAAIAVLK